MDAIAALERYLAEGRDQLSSERAAQVRAQIASQKALTAEPREYRDNDPEALTKRVLGFPVPIDGLADWVQGKPSPQLEARGWKVEYQDKDAQGRPTRMRLTYQGIELRLAVSQWN